MNAVEDNSMNKAPLLKSLLVLCKRSILLISIISLLVFLSGCGGGTTSSGFNEDSAIESAQEYVGVYLGLETIVLRNIENESIVDEQENDVTIVVDADGIIQLSIDSGTSGSTQLAENLFFSFSVDARLILDGRCSSGEVFLTGFIESINSIIAEYGSTGLVCDNMGHELSGGFTAER